MELQIPIRSLVCRDFLRMPVAARSSGHENVDIFYIPASEWLPKINKLLFLKGFFKVAHELLISLSHFSPSINSRSES